jgi:hypothetical protein
MLQFVKSRSTECFVCAAIWSCTSMKLRQTHHSATWRNTKYNTSNQPLKVWVEGWVKNMDYPKPTLSVYAGFGLRIDRLIWIISSFSRGLRTADSSIAVNKASIETSTYTTRETKWISNLIAKIEHVDLFLCQKQDVI